jgi:hypothetical protein
LLLLLLLAVKKAAVDWDMVTDCMIGAEDVLVYRLLGNEWTCCWWSAFGGDGWSILGGEKELLDDVLCVDGVG